jgi:hypothetical protein
MFWEVNMEDSVSRWCGELQHGATDQKNKQNTN